MQKITCFKTYDIRGKIGENINKEIMYCIGRSLAQHFNAKYIVIGYDVRQTSRSFAGLLLMVIWIWLQCN